jgi:hypothetical protein
MAGLHALVRFQPIVQMMRASLQPTIAAQLAATNVRSKAIG